MGNKEYCCEILRKPNISEIKKQEIILNVLGSMLTLERSLDKIRCYLFPNELIFTLAVYLNAIYCFLLESKEIINHASDIFYISNKFIKNLESILGDLDNILDIQKMENGDFFRHQPNNQFLSNIIKHVEAAFKMTILQADFLPFGSVSALNGEFSLDFSELLYKMSSNLVSEVEELQLLYESITIKETLICRNCNISMIKINFEKESLFEKTMLVCCCCEKKLDINKKYLFCANEKCQKILCKICSFQTSQNLKECYFCSFDKNKNKKNRILVKESEKCCLCFKEFHSSQIYSWNNDDENPINVCLFCSEQPDFMIQTEILIENQRFWKGYWIDCPVLPNERTKFIDKNLNPKQKDDMDIDSNKIWLCDWNIIVGNNDDEWEYSLNWGREFSSDKNGCYVRRRKWIRNFIEKREFN